MGSEVHFHELQGHFGGMSLMSVMRRASEFRELLTEKSSIFVLKIPAIIFNYDKNKTKNIQIHHFKDEIINQNTNKEKTFGTQGLNPGRLGTSPTL